MNDIGSGWGGFWGLLFLGILEEVCWGILGVCFGRRGWGIGNLRFGMGHGFGIWFFGFWMAGCVWEGFRLGCVLQAWEMNFQIGFASGRKDGWLEAVGEAGVVELAASEI